MNPIRINLAKPHINRHIDYIPLLLMSIVMLALVLLNGYRYLQMRTEITEYDKTLVRQTLMNKAVMRQHPQTSAPQIAASEINALKEKCALVNQIILDDRFAWTDLLDLLETTMPQGLLISHLDVSDNLGQLVIKGRAASPHELGRFIRTLSTTEIFKNSILSAISMPITDPPKQSVGQSETGLDYEIVIALYREKMAAFSLSGRSHGDE